jgi:ADP-ribosylglycohydrolase
MPPSASDRLAAARQSLDGLSVGDAFGECFFSIAINQMSLDLHLSTRTLPNHRWRWTDDTAMAVSIVEVLERNQQIDQADLAVTFAMRYALEDNRGYGGTAHGILRAIGEGQPWSSVSPAVLSGMGSMGNGGAMRVAPLGVYFAHDPEELVVQARLSAEVTHAHPDGQAGAIAVALAAAFVATNPALSGEEFRRPFFDFILKHLPDSETRARVVQASDLPSDYTVETAASVLGNGSRITAPDTVPYCLWCAARCIGNFEEAMWTTVSGGGDMDTTCAIVGGIVASAQRGMPSPEWIARREPLPTEII